MCYEFEYDDVLDAYEWNGEIAGILPYGMGHINSTYCMYIQTLTGACKRYILQKINTDTFKDVEGLMENITGVTSYIRKKIEEKGEDPKRRVMNVHYTKNGKSFFLSPKNGAWRVYDFVEDTICLQHVEKAEDFYESAAAFGEFQMQLDGYPAEKIHEVIPNFHNTVMRYENLMNAIKNDKVGRVALVKKEIEFAIEREKDTHFMIDLLHEGNIPLRVTHNDTKLNNVLIDKKTRKGICVIDLDTVMPGLAANDFGDAIRFGANNCEEDEIDQTKVHFSLDLYKVYLKGYMEKAGSVLTETEKRTLHYGAKLMTLECGMRFLTDYLEGDHYFHTVREHQNLDRARTQFKLVSDMEEQFDDMLKASEKYI